MDRTRKLARKRLGAEQIATKLGQIEGENGRLEKQVLKGIAEG